ncbi:MAG: MFS transporter [Clostridia bacterium]|nr:MFS transporter [Clostridia bacterium]
MKRKPDYKWFVIAICVMMMFFGLGFCSSNKAIYLSAITDALGFSRGAYSIGDSFRYLTTAILNLFFGALVHRFGTKKLIVAGMICLVGSCVLAAVAKQLPLFYLSGVLLGAGLSWTTTTMVGLIVPRWVKKNTGTVMGVVFCSNAVGGAVAAQIMTPIIYQESTAFGYRYSYWLIAAILVLVTLLIVLFYRENPPQSTDDQPMAHKKKTTALWVGLDGHTIRKRPYFYIVLACVTVVGMILQNIGSAVVADLQDMGIADGMVATMVSIGSIALALAKLVVGRLYDVRGLRTSVNFCMICGVLGIAVLFFVNNSPFGIAMGILYKILIAIALPMDTIMLPLLAGGLFGDRCYVKILGYFSAVYVGGCAVGAPLIHWVYDAFGTYMPAYIVAGVLLLVVLCIYQYVFAAAKKDRLAVEEKLKEAETTV